MNGTENRDMILKSLNASLKSKKLYPPGHPSIMAPVRKTYQSVTEALKTQNNFMIGIVHETLVFEDDMISGGERLYPDIIFYMSEKNVDTIIFERGATEKEVASLIDVFTGGAELKGKELQKELHSKGITHITLKSVPIGKKNVLEIYNGAVETVKNVMGEIRLGKLPKSEPVNEVIEEITDSVFSDQNAILGLTMIKNYDNYLYNHSVNVSIMALSLGRYMNLSKEDLHVVGVAALLHDIGKTGVAEDIIRKPGGLSSEEWDKIKEHPLLGSNIIKRMEGMDELIGRIIYEHHIKYDHSGYPQNAGNTHPLSHIVSISDAYDALTTLRVYQKPSNPVEAIKIMSNFSGRHFHPDTLKAFVNMLGLYPVGTMVRLSTNEIAIVTKEGPGNADRPTVKVVYDKDGNELAAPVEVDLSQDKAKNIVSTVNPATTNTNVAAFFEKESAA